MGWRNIVPIEPLSQQFGHEPAEALPFATLASLQLGEHGWVEVERRSRHDA